MIRFFIIPLIFLSVIGCHKGSQNSGLLNTKVDLTNFDEDFVMPTSLWNTLESAFPELTITAVKSKTEEEEKTEKEAKKEKVEKKLDPRTLEAKKEEEELLRRRPSLDGLRFKVDLVEKTDEIFDHHNYEINFGSGGGTLDLKDYYPEKKNGTFFLKVIYGQPMDPKKTKIFYLSNAPFRSDLKMGSGCNKYFEITKFWNQAMKDDGLNLNTVNLRHLSATAGTFFFVCPFQGKLRLGHLTIKDSRHLDLLCKPEIKN